MSLKQWFSALLLAGIVCSYAYSQEKATEKPATTVPDFSKEAYVIEKSYTRITAENDGTGMREVMANVKVLADAGVKAFAVLSFTYTSANEVVDIDYVRVRKPDGTVVKTPDYNIQDMPGEVTRTAPLYSDIHEKHVAVKSLGVGDELEYLVRYRVIKPEVPGQFWQEYSFFKDAIAKDERFELSFPSGKYVKVVSPEFKPEITEEGGRKVYRWTHSNLTIRQKAPGEMPRRIPPKPDVQITTFASWEDVGRWYGDLQKEPLQVTPAIQKKADELTKGLKTDDEKIRAIYNFVALKYHYIGLDFGIGRYQPHAADDVLDNGYGDCKDKHTLMASLLKAEGIEAWPALIHSTRKLDPDVPSPAQFNHVITAVPRGDKFVWLDTTPEVAPYEVLMLTLRGKQALVVPASKPPVVMTTPQNAPFQQVQSMTMEGKLNAEGTFTGHSEQSYHGDAEVVLRTVFRQVPQSQWKEAVQRFSYGLNFGGDVSNVNMTQPDDLSKQFELSYDYERKNYGGWEDRQITAPLPPLGVEMMKDAKKPQERVVLGGLGEVVYKGEVTLPPGYSGTAPKDVDLVRTYAEYHSTYSIDKGVFTAKRRLVIKKPEVELSSWEEFRDFAKAVSDDENRFVALSGGIDVRVSGATSKSSTDLDAKFREGYGALQQRDLTRAEELFKQILVADPKYHLAHYNIGVVLVSRGRINEAITEFRKEEEITPDNVQSYQMAATYSAMMNRRDEAVEDWRRLLKTDPKNRDAALNLGRLLQMSGKSSQVLTVLEEANKQSPGSPALEMALGEAYVQAGEAEKGISRMNDAMKDGADARGIDPGMLNDAAFWLAARNTHLEQAKAFGEKAVAALDARSAESVDSEPENLLLVTEFAAAWDTLGLAYFYSGDMSRAEDYLRAAWALGQNAVSGDHLAYVLEKTGKKKEAEHLLRLALSAQSQRTTMWGVAGDAAQESASALGQHQALLSHYKELTGRPGPPPIDIKRLPNGEWTKTPSDELKDALRVKLGKTLGATGHAEYSVVFASGSVESVRYRNGDGELKSLAERLQATHFPSFMPENSGAKIVRRVKLSCGASSGCIAEMVLPSQVMMVMQ